MLASLVTVTHDGDVSGCPVASSQTPMPNPVTEWMMVHRRRQSPVRNVANTEGPRKEFPRPMVTVIENMNLTLGA